MANFKHDKVKVDSRFAKFFANDEFDESQVKDIRTGKLIKKNEFFSIDDNVELTEDAKHVIEQIKKNSKKRKNKSKKSSHKNINTIEKSVSGDLLAKVNENNANNNFSINNNNTNDDKLTFSLDATEKNIANGLSIKEKVSRASFSIDTNNYDDSNKQITTNYTIITNKEPLNRNMPIHNNFVNANNNMINTNEQKKRSQQQHNQAEIFDINKHKNIVDETALLDDEIIEQQHTELDDSTSVSDTEFSQDTSTEYSDINQHVDGVYRSKQKIIISDSESDDDIKMYRRKIEQDVWGNYEKEDEIIKDSTTRIAILRCLWDEITATSIYILCHSLIPDGVLELDEQNHYKSNKIINVAIYKSQFGNECLKYEEQHGPKLIDIELLSKKNKSNNNNYSDSEDRDIKALAIRKYQQDKCKYYYAVVECDSTTTADYIYDQLNNVDAGFAVDYLEVKYIPDNITDFVYEPTSYADFMPKDYIAPDIVYSSLKHTNVRLTFDETSDKRKKIFQKLFTNEDLAEEDLKNYISSANDETDNDDIEQLNEKRKMLIDAITKKDSEEQIYEFTNNEKSDLNQQEEDRTITNNISNNSNNDSNDDFILVNELSESDNDEIVKNISPKKNCKKQNKYISKEKAKDIDKLKSSLLSKTKEDVRFKEFLNDKDNFVDATEFKRIKINNFY